MKKEKKQKKAKKAKGQQEEVSPNPAVIEKGKKLKKDIDEMLDKVDDLLHENAEEFVNNYIQKGGEWQKSSASYKV